MATPNIIILPDTDRRCSPRTLPSESRSGNKIDRNMKQKARESYIDLLSKNGYHIIEVYQGDISVIKTINWYGQDILFIIDESIPINSVHRVDCVVRDIKDNTEILDTVEYMGDNINEFLSLCNNTASSCAVQREDRIMIYHNKNISIVYLNEPSLNTSTDYRIYPVTNIKDLILCPEDTNLRLANEFIKIRSLEYEMNLTALQNVYRESFDVNCKIKDIKRHYEHNMEDTFERINNELLDECNLNKLRELEKNITTLNINIQRVNIPKLLKSLKEIRETLDQYS